MVRPKFSETTTAIKSSMHPILALSQQQHAPVPNDVYLSRDTNFVIISGPNMVRYEEQREALTRRR
eukprot:m.283027 g.283027  ORF g.283027 m.283027 type:complete len:66 (+) comp15755_c0_seq76:2637-2834(+)